MFQNLDLIGVIVILLVVVPVLLVIFMVPIGDWLSEREKRKKSAAAAEGAQPAADGVESPVAKPA